MGPGNLCVRFSAETSVQHARHQARRRGGLRVFPVLLMFVVAIAAQAQQYTKIVVFGDSLSDTGNDAIVFTETYGFPFPSPLGDYTLGRFTDGPDTLPPAMRYFGVWVEQMAAALPAHPAVLPSLIGGTNYAYGYANTFDGTTLFNVTGTPYTIVVQNVGEQIEQYLAKHPKIDSHTLFVVWGGANDLTEAVGAADAPAKIIDGAVTQVANIQRKADYMRERSAVSDLRTSRTWDRCRDSNSSPVDSAAFA